MILVRPSMPETTALGAAMAAGAAEGIDVWDIWAKDSPQRTTDTFYPTIALTGQLKTVTLQHNSSN